MPARGERDTTHTTPGSSTAWRGGLIDTERKRLAARQTLQSMFKTSDTDEGK